MRKQCLLLMMALASVASAQEAVEEEVVADSIVPEVVDSIASVAAEDSLVSEVMAPVIEAAVRYVMAPTDSVARIYEQRLDSLQGVMRQLERQASLQGNRVKLNPYFYRLMLPGTLYQSPMQQAFAIAWQPQHGGSPAPSLFGGTGYDTMQVLDLSTGAALARVYADNPSLIVRTEQEMREEPTLRTEVQKPVESTVKLAEQAVKVELPDEVSEPVEIVAKKPNFWKLFGNGSLQFTQNYFSENWYQGGESNYAAMAAVTLEANYDNKQKLQWDNKLEMQLGFQTNLSDDYHKFKATNNLLRMTSKVGYKAAKNWFYSAQVLGYTQFVPNYDSNKNTFSSRFASPFDLNVSVGMDYKFKSKKGKFSGSLYLAPVAWNSRYVANDSLRPKYLGNQPKREKSKHDFGPSLMLNYKWEICKNITWNGRVFYFCAPFNDARMYMEWENTFSFNINKYLSCKFYLYPRLDNNNLKNWKKANPDQAVPTRGDGSSLYDPRQHKVFMFKEWLSLGLSYKF